jgi:hypothetical protein
MSGGFFLSDDDSDDDGRGGEYAGAGEYSDGRGGEYAGAGEYSDDEGQREQYYGYNDDGEDRSDPFQRAPEDVLKKRKMVRASLLSPARHRTSASAAVSASTAPIVNLTGSPGSDNGAEVEDLATMQHVLEEIIDNDINNMEDTFLDCGYFWN